MEERGPETLSSILARYMQARDRGEPLARDELLAAHPEHADALRAHFEAEDLLGVRDVPADPAPGAVVGPYEILAEIARGGMGIVYRARHRELDRSVALKMIRLDHPDPEELLQRFRIEAAAAAHLEHPGIVPIYEFGDHGGRPWFTMPLVPGGSLAARLAEFQGDPRRVAGLVAALAEAVHFGHTRGVIHRDLKPGNVLLDAAGNPLVVDFGLAKRLESGQRTLTGAYDLLGTPAYMAPEQILAGAAALTPAADIWALGVILYELLAGRTPYEGETPADTIRRVELEEPDPLRRLVPSLPRDLETICLACLEKEPARRYPTAHDLARDLRRFLQHESIIARRPGVGRRAWLFARRRRAALALAVVALLAVGALWAWRASERRAVVSSMLERAHEAAREARPVTAGLYYAAAHRLDPSPASALGVRMFDGEPPVQVLAPEAGAIRRLRFLDDRRLAVVTAGGRVSVYDWRSGDATDLRATGPQTDGLARLAGGTRFVTADHDGALILWDADTGARVAAVDTKAPPLDDVVVAGDLVFATGEGERVHVWNPATGSLESIAVDPAGRTGNVDAGPVAVRPGRGEIAVGAGVAGEAFVRFLDLETRRFLPEVLRHHRRVWRLLYLPDGRLVSADDRGLRFFDAARRPDGPVLEQGAPVGALCFEPRGATILAGSTNAVVRRWRAGIRQPAGRDLPDAGAVYALAVTPDGSFVAAGGANDRVRVWPVPAGPSDFGFLHGVTGNVVWDDTGRRVLAVRGNRCVEIVARSLAEERSWPLPAGRQPVGFLDGRWALASQPPDPPALERLPPGPAIRLPADAWPTVLWGRLFLADRNFVFHEARRRGERVERGAELGRGAPFWVSPNGKRAGLWGADGTLVVRDLATGAIVASRLHAGASPSRLALPDDGSWCAFGGASKEEFVFWDLRRGEVRRRPRDPLGGGLVYELPGRSDLLVTGTPARGALGFRLAATLEPAGRVITPWGVAAERELRDMLVARDGRAAIVRWNGGPNMVWRLDRLLDGGEPDPVRASLLAMKRIRDDGTEEEIGLAEWRRLRRAYGK